MKSIEREAKTVDEAIMKGLTFLGLSIDEVKIEILEEGSKGFLTLGSKLARVRITEKKTGGAGQDFLEGLLERMDVLARVQPNESEEAYLYEIVGENIGTVIGHRGETLDAIQYLTSLIVNKEREDYIRVTVDAENYRGKREQSLIRLANRMADKAARTGRRVALEPMNPFERRILHSALQGHSKVTTASEGEEPNRRVIIKPIH